MSDRRPAAIPADPLEWLRDRAPWLSAPRLLTCVVGTHALAIACERAGEPGPQPRDLDLSWGLDVDAGRELLESHGVFLPTTPGNLGRGTLAMKLDGARVEVTTFRAGDGQADPAQRIAADLGGRDMTAGALAVELASGAVHDPFGGLADFRARRVVPVGDPVDRVREHPVRWLRYFRKAHEWGFELDRRLRHLPLPPAILDAVPREAVAAEVRAALLLCASPGRFFVELHEVGLLAHLLPQLDLQFDGRPAGPQQWHPEISQALHLVLALEWAATHSSGLDERDRLAVLFAVLCHDLGKGYTDPAELPAHAGHERRGLSALDDIVRSLPGIADPRGHQLARAVCELHVQIRRMQDLRAGTLARLYERWFRPRDFPIHLFALAVAADSGGRLGFAEEGARIRDRLAAELQWLRERCEQVDAAALRRHCRDVESFRSALHEARARAIADGRTEAQRQQGPSQRTDAAAP